MEDAKQLLREEIKQQCSNIPEIQAKIAATCLFTNIKPLIDTAVTLQYIMHTYGK